MNQLIMGAMLLTWCAGTLAGCATTEKKTYSQDRPITTTVANNRIIYLTTSNDNGNGAGDIKRSLYAQKSQLRSTEPPRTTESMERITLVEVTDGDGKKVCTSVMPVYSGDLLVSDLRKGLTAAGYTVIPVRKLPEKAEKGIDLSWISTGMEQNSGLVTLEGKCQLQVRLDLWRNGAKTVSHDYTAVVSDYAITDQKGLLVKLMKKATQDITVQAVPTIIADISASGSTTKHP
jgi:hypothetical protein